MGERMTLQEWKEKNKYARKYAHFDRKVSLKQVWDYISNPIKVKEHSFYPFIYYIQKFNKFSHGKIKPKERKLSYSAHVDRYIYSYYGFLINEQYNIRATQDRINEVVIAYRNNLRMNNIHFAKKAVDYIRSLESCYIMVGDFTSFFDNLDHRYLKERLCDLLEMNSLPADYYAVYKNITKYSIWERDDILDYYGLNNNKKGIEALNSREMVFSIDEYRKLREEDSKGVRAKKNENNFGIPQGSAISAVLSNVYMLEADKELNGFVKKYGGLYMRYSDDMIIILPKISKEAFETQYSKIMSILDSVPRVQLQKEKTQVYCYNQTELKNCNELVMEGVSNGSDKLDYLGFTFDGKEVIIRDKTTSKYYYRMYRKLKTIVKCNGVTKEGNRISSENIYIKYSIKGVKTYENKNGIKNKGNFISYVKRAEAIWGPNEPIGRGTKRHMIKIRRQLDKIK